MDNSGQMNIQTTPMGAQPMMGAQPVGAVAGVATASGTATPQGTTAVPVVEPAGIPTDATANPTMGAQPVSASPSGDVSGGGSATSSVVNTTAQIQ